MSKKQKCETCGGMYPASEYRDTCSDNCNACDWLLGQDNYHNDSGEPPTATELAGYDGCLRVITEAGGNAELVKGFCEYIWTPKQSPATLPERLNEVAAILRPLNAEAADTVVEAAKELDRLRASRDDWQVVANERAGQIKAALAELS